MTLPINTSSQNLIQDKITSQHPLLQSGLGNSKAKLKEISQDFESFFIYQTMELMNAGLPGAETDFGGGYGEEMFTHILNEHMAENITEAGGFGIADTIYAQLVKYQEAE